MRFSRRECLQMVSKSLPPLAMVAGASGLYCAGRERKRRALKGTMLSLAVPKIAATAAKEQVSIPAQAREEMQNFFDQACLNASTFSKQICSWAFAERINACSTRAAQLEMIATAFDNDVLSAEDILERVRRIGQSVGATLTANWTECCHEVATGWKTIGDGPQPSASVAQLESITKESLQQRLQPILDEASRITGKPAPSDIGMEIVAAATSTLAYMRISRTVAVLNCLYRALVHILPRLLEYFSHQYADYQARVSKELARLGKRLAEEYASEIRQRLDLVQAARRESLDKFVEQHAWAAIPMWIG